MIKLKSENFNNRTKPAKPYPCYTVELKNFNRIFYVKAHQKYLKIVKIIIMIKKVI